MPVHEHLGRLRTVLIRVASGLVVVSAAFGVIAVLTGGFGETEARILGTALLVAAGVFAVLAGAAPGSRSWRRLASFVAVSVSPVAAASTIALIWRDEPSDVVVRIVVTLLCVAVGALAVRLIASLQIGPGWERYAIATSALGAALTCHGELRVGGATRRDDRPVVRRLGGGLRCGRAASRASGGATYDTGADRPS